MIKTENLTINDKALIRTYSDENRYVVREGVSYSEAIDPVELGRIYTEGELMELESMTELEEKAAAYDILMGVTE